MRARRVTNEINSCRFSKYRRNRRKKGQDRHASDVATSRQTYQEKVMSAGLRASGNSKWLAATVAIGRIATKSVILQPTGTNGATAMTIMPTMKITAKAMENLNYNDEAYVSVSQVD